MIKMHMPKLASVRGQTLLTDNKPYLFRQSPIASQMLEDMIVGGTVAWNQLADANNAETWASTVTVSGHEITCVTTRDYTQMGYNIILDGLIQNNHVYLEMVKIKSASFTPTSITLILSNGWAIVSPLIVRTWAGEGVYCGIEKTTSGGTSGTRQRVLIRVDGNSVTGDTFVTSSTMVIDLTQMFGSTIADYVYTLEQSTAGSGIAWLKSYGFFTEDYYPYDAGSLLSVKTSGHKTVKNGVEHTYPLSDIDLRGIPKLVNNELQYDGDTYASDGTVTRKWGVLTLDGSENWYVRDGKTNEFVVRTATDAFVINSSTQTTVVGIVASRFANATWAVYNIQAPDKTVSLFYGQPWIIFRDTSFSDVASWKTSLSTNPITVAYMLKEPTTETTDAFTNPQTAGSTEEYIDERTVPMPVGHVTEYFNMEQKEQIQMHMATHSPIKMHMEG